MSTCKVITNKKPCGQPVKDYDMTTVKKYCHAHYIEYLRNKIRDAKDALLFTKNVEERRELQEEIFIAAMNIATDAVELQPGAEGFDEALRAYWPAGIPITAPPWR